MVDEPSVPDKTDAPAAVWVALMPVTLSAAEHDCLEIIQALSLSYPRPGTPPDEITEAQLFDEIFGADDNPKETDIDAAGALSSLEDRKLIATGRRPDGTLVYSITDTGRLWWARRENDDDDRLPDGVRGVIDALSDAQAREVAEYAAFQVGMELAPEDDDEDEDGDEGSNKE
jgi:hypothetical protein